MIKSTTLFPSCNNFFLKSEPVARTRYSYEIIKLTFSYVKYYQACENGSFSFVENPPCLRKMFFLRELKLTRSKELGKDSENVFLRKTYHTCYIRTYFVTLRSMAVYEIISSAVYSYNCSNFKRIILVIELITIMHCEVSSNIINVITLHKWLTVISEFKSRVPETNLGSIIFCSHVSWSKITSWIHDLDQLNWKEIK